MTDEVLITFLPNEIIELILENDFITIKDTVNFALSNKHFYKTVFESNKIWRIKLFQKYVKHFYSYIIGILLLHYKCLFCYLDGPT